MNDDIFGSFESSSGRDCSGCCSLPPPAIPPPAIPPPSSPASGLATVFSGDDLELMTALVTDAALALGVVTVYLVLHRTVTSFYYTNPAKRGRGPPQPEGACGWLGVVWRITDDEIERHAGLDAVVFLSFIRMVIKILVLAAPFALVLAMPTY